MMMAPAAKTVSFWISSPGQIQFLWQNFDIYIYIVIYCP